VVAVVWLGSLGVLAWRWKVFQDRPAVITVRNASGAAIHDVAVRGHGEDGAHVMGLIPAGEQRAVEVRTRGEVVVGLEFRREDGRRYRPDGVYCGAGGPRVTYVVEARPAVSVEVVQPVMVCEPIRNAYVEDLVPWAPPAHPPASGH
jgi:hypothetical protein